LAVIATRRYPRVFGRLAGAVTGWNSRIGSASISTLERLGAGLGAPDDIARVYLPVIERNPEAVAAALDE
jgi:hypothetical protein